MVVFTLMIINKAGGLIYNHTFSPGLQKITSNDSLILAGTFHGIHAISKSICPIPPQQQQQQTITPATPSGNGGVPGAANNRRVEASGITSLESAHFKLTCFQSVTGLKFLLFTSPEQPNADVVLRRCYEIYADSVMKNPFYTPEMPIRVEKFDRALDGYLVRP